MNYPKVSVILPCYNYGKYLERAVNSVLSQTYQGFEIIILDDHSNDGTHVIAQRLCTTDDRIRYIRQQYNVGQSKNRNIGIRLATGEFIAMLDADDAYKPTFFETLLPAFENKQVGVAYSLREQHTLEGVSLNQLDSDRVVSGDVLKNLVTSNFVGTSVIFRKTALPMHGYDEQLSPHINNMGIDWWILLEIAAHGWHFVGFDQSLYNYTIHDNQMSSNLERRIEGDRIILQKFFERYPYAINSLKKRSYFWQYIREGYYLRQMNKKRRALKSYITAITINPFSLLPYKALISTLLKG